MAKRMTKAASIKRLKEARQKVFTCIIAGHISIDAGNKAIKPLSNMISRLEK
jgi:predicted DNA-binding protein (UPF0251 family)